MADTDQLQLRSQVLGPLPVINHFCARLGLDELLERFLPDDDARLRLAPARVVSVVVRNLVIGREPVYALGEWAAPYDPWLLGLADAGDVAALNSPGYPCGGRPAGVKIGVVARRRRFRLPL
ncbi:MAG: DUF4277 domain-containing protein [Streptosporangiaceae bacterium]